MRSALRDANIRILWAGQALSSIGDEIYRVGLTWLAVGLLGPDTGLLNAGQAAALMILSLVGGRWADRWAPLQTMVRIDLIRGCIVLVPVIVSFFHPVPLALLVGTALSLAALGAFFDPALQSTLPHFARDAKLLRSANGLMSTTMRLARMVGPMLIGLLSHLLPMIHFFTLDAVSFFASAFSVHRIKAEVPAPSARSEGRASFLQTIQAGFRTVAAQPGMPFIFWLKALTGGTWNLAFALGIAMLVQQLAPGDARAFGLVVASYGAGNFLGALYFGNHHRPHPGRLMFWGYALFGTGFICVGCAPTILWMMGTACFSGFAGPMNELAFSDTIQSRFPAREISRVFRLRMAVETLSTLVFTGLSPLMIRVLTVRGTIVLCGLTWLICGLLGFARLDRVEAEEGAAAARG